MNLVFANSNKEEVIYPLTVTEIAQAQQDDPNLQALEANDIHHETGRKHEGTLHG